MMVGKTISHYQITEKLGEGGMGIVYKAEDTRLERNVAIKFLPENLARDQDEKNRLIREARAAAALNHPNISTIYAIEEKGDELFIVMEYIDGQDLSTIIKERMLTTEETLQFAIPLCNGLQAAHDQGIIHGDIKSSNIMLNQQGLLKIMDFGLATFLGHQSNNFSDSTRGTPVYMSPEHAMGAEIDQRSDIWSFGVVIYEMLTGQLPFQGEYNQVIIYSIINSDPEPFDEEIPETFQNIILRCLEKEADKRFQSMREIHELLVQISEELHLPAAERETLRSKYRLAVLPFTNISPNPDDEYFADGLTEELITTLSKLNDLRIISRTSVIQYKVIKKSIKEIGKELNVGTVLQGSIRKSNHKLRISVQLTDTNSEELLWSNTYDRKLKDILTIQCEIARAIADALKLRLLKKEKSAINNTVTQNIQAFRNYLKGRYYWNKRTKDSLEKSVSFFTQALDEDPIFALAYAGLADAYIILGDYNHLLPQEAYPKARAAAEKALEIDAVSVQAHTSLARVKAVYDWDWTEAEKEFTAALDINSQYATAYHWYAINVLVPLGRFKEAQKQIAQALDLDPLSMIINVTAGLIQYYAGNFSEAIRIYQKTLDVDPHFGAAHYFMSWALAQEKRKDEAIVAMKKAINNMEDSMALNTELAYLFVLFDNQKFALQLIKHLKITTNDYQISPSLMYSIAALYTAIGKDETALQWLEKAYQEKSFRLIYLNVDPWFTHLKQYPRFQNLLKKIGLVNQTNTP